MGISGTSKERWTVDDATRLAPPGAGVPWWQRLVGKHFFLPLYCRRGWDGARELLHKEGTELLGLGQGFDPEQLVRRVLVPRQIGLEDSSRCWSYAMVLEHLGIIGTQTVAIIVDLSHGRAPERPPVDTRDLKPLGTASAADAMAGFRDFLHAFHRQTRDEVGERDSPTRFIHPWFGPLTARQWICFLPFHQRLHILQAKRILASR